MNNKWVHALSLEVFWFALIALFVIFSVLPVYGVITDNYVLTIAALSLLFAFYFRIVVFFRQIIYLRPLAVQVILFLAHIPLFVIVLGQVQEMIYRFDTHDLTRFFVSDNGLSPEELVKKFRLFRTEFLVYSVGSLILVVLAEFRIVLAFVERIRKIE